MQRYLIQLPIITIQKLLQEKATHRLKRAHQLNHKEGEN